jgi:formylglycine-generating enzyme required for sulfatase activity
VAIARTDAAALLLGVSSDRLPAAVRGFRPASAVKAPSYSFELQQHEVTWGELRTWLARRPELAVGPPPAWVPETGASSFPATGVTWGTARDYCESLGGALPTEPEWELAARGERRRPFPWGAATIDLARTHAFRPGAPLSKVMANPQDVTPGSPEQALHDMAGNALEWTADLYRGDEPGRDDLPAQREDLVFRAVRGLPPAAEPPVHIQAEGAAYRDAGCAEGDCSAFGAASLQYVGFRCVRRPATASVEPAPPPPVAAPPDAGPAQTEPQTPPIKRTGPRGPGRGPIAPNPY